MMNEFFFLRHGETDWNVANRLQGQISAIPLNKRSLQQATAAAMVLATQSFDLIISSTLGRAVMTAEIIAEHTGQPLMYDSRLIERGLGIAEGKTIDEIRAMMPEEHVARSTCRDPGILMFDPESAETREALEERATSAFWDLMAQYRKSRLLFVSHGGWLKLLLHRLTGQYVRLGNACPYKAFEQPAGWQIDSLAT